MDKVFYNKSSADSLGWTPEWFNVEYFDDSLVKAIKRWQNNNGLTADGLCGPGTFRRIFTERENKIHNYMPQIFSNQLINEQGEKQKHIVHNGNFFEIDWPLVRLWSEDWGFEAKKGTYYDYTGKPDRKPTFFVNHWDVCLSSESCHKVLKNRGISVHFLIDNDGTIYQTMDTQHGAWHAGGSKWNHKSIGVEIIRFKGQFLRLGYAIGGITKKSMSLGYGRKLGPLHWDIGMSFNGGFSIETAKGFDIAMGLAWQMKEKRRKIENFR